MGFRDIFRKPDRNGQSCENCCHFIDHRSPPEDNFGYCGELVNRLGLEEAVKVNPYGGRWVDGGEWCERWQGGPNLWPIVDAQ